MEHGDNQRDGTSEDRTDGEPLQAFSIVPDRAGIANSER
jgi:hypothetical protein